MKTLLRIVFVLMCALTACHSKAQNLEQIYRQAKAIAEANAPAVYLRAPGTDMKNIVLKSLSMPYYFLLTWTQNGRYCRYEFPVKGTSALVGSDGIFEFNLPKLTMTKLSTGEKLQFEVIGSSGGSNIIIPEDNSSEGGSSAVERKKCSLCKGKGWTVGSKNSTYGLSGKYWCEDCQQNVSYSHSHDRCPSCCGKGYINSIK